MFHKIRPPKDSAIKNNNKRKGKGKAQPDTDSTDVTGHTDEVWALALSPDGRLLASAGKDRRVGVWDVEKNEWVKGFPGHRDSISVRIPHFRSYDTILKNHDKRLSHSEKPLPYKLPQQQHNYTPVLLIVPSNCLISPQVRWVM